MSAFEVREIVRGLYGKIGVSQAEIRRVREVLQEWFLEEVDRMPKDAVFGILEVVLRVDGLFNGEIIRDVGGKGESNGDGEEKYGFLRPVVLGYGDRSDVPLVYQFSQQQIQRLLYTLAVRLKGKEYESEIVDVLIDRFIDTTYYLDSEGLIDIMDTLKKLRLHHDYVYEHIVNLIKQQATVESKYIFLLKYHSENHICN